MKAEPIRILTMYPGKYSIIKRINFDLQEMQKIVGGYIKITHPFADKTICVVCNEDQHGEANRMIGKKIYTGPIFIVRYDKTDDVFESLTDTDIAVYNKILYYPQRFARTDTGAIWVDTPDKDFAMPTLLK